MSTAPDWPDRAFVTTKELAGIARVVERTILREIERGHLTATRHGGYVIDVAEAKRWLTAYQGGSETP